MQNAPKGQNNLRTIIQIMNYGSGGAKHLAAVLPLRGKEVLILASNILSLSDKISISV
jgi:hypothetical protein